jgi:Zn-dependent protease with chaperone function
VIDGTVSDRRIVGSGTVCGESVLLHVMATKHTKSRKWERPSLEARLLRVRRGMFPSMDQELRVDRWPTERPLLILNALASAALWYALLRSFASLPLIAGWAFLVVLMNIAFVTSIRGSAVRLGPEQFPELYARVEELARRFGIRRMPGVYLMQQDGALNAFAMRFLRSHMVVLLSDLLEACGDNQAARDMIIGHELGHIRAGHLRARWLLMPASFVPISWFSAAPGARVHM